MAADRVVRIPTSVGPPLRAELGEEPEEGLPMRVLAEQTQHDPPARPHHSAGDRHEGVRERFELHPQHPPFFLPVRVGPAARRLRQQQRPPRFERPGQGRRTIRAPLLSSVFTGADNARTPPCNCANKFSWLQRSLASNTTSSADNALSSMLVMVKKYRISGISLSSPFSFEMCLRIATMR